MKSEYNSIKNSSLTEKIAVFSRIIQRRSIKSEYNTVREDYSAGFSKGDKNFVQVWGEKFFHVSFRIKLHKIFQMHFVQCF